MRCPKCGTTIDAKMIAKDLRSRVKNNARSTEHYQLMAKKSAEARRKNSLQISAKNAKNGAKIVKSNKSSIRTK
jgi:hypothetical protein